MWKWKRSASLWRSSPRHDGVTGADQTRHASGVSTLRTPWCSRTVRALDRDDVSTEKEKPSRNRVTSSTCSSTPPRVGGKASFKAWSTLTGPREFYYAARASAKR